MIKLKPVFNKFIFFLPLFWFKWENAMKLNLSIFQLHTSFFDSHFSKPNFHVSYFFVRRFHFRCYQKTKSLKLRMFSLFTVDTRHMPFAAYMAQILLLNVIIKKVRGLSIDTRCMFNFHMNYLWADQRCHRI